MVQDQEFREYSDQDIKMSEEQTIAREYLNLIIEAEKSGDMSQLEDIDTLYREDGDKRSLKDIVQGIVNNTKQQRLELYKKYNKNYDRKI